MAGRYTILSRDADFLSSSVPWDIGERWCEKKHGNGEPTSFQNNDLFLMLLQRDTIEIELLRCKDCYVFFLLICNVEKMINAVIKN